jgi:hypothetical protein
LAFFQISPLLFELFHGAVMENRKLFIMQYILPEEDQGCDPAQ